MRPAAREVLENEVATDQRPDGRADGVETLCEVQPAGRRLLRAKNGDEGIGRDLQHGKTQTDDEQPGQEHRIGGCVGRRPEQGATGRRGEQTDDHAVFVADFRDRIAGRRRDDEVDEGTDEIGPEKRLLHKHRMGVI